MHAVTLLAAVAMPPIPDTPEVTDIHRSVIAKTAAQAKGWSAAARPLVLEAMEGADFRYFLSQYSTELAALPSPELLGRLEEATRVAEIVHNVDAVGAGHNDDNYTTLDAPFFLNLWQLPLLGLRPKSEPGPEGGAEVTLLGFPAFKNNSAITWEEASSRVLYGAHELARIDCGNPLFGDLSLVFNTTHIKDYTIYSGADTGMFDMTCLGQSHHHSWGHSLNCSGYGTWQLGTYEDNLHLLLPNTRFFNESSVVADAHGRSYAARNLALRFARGILRWGEHTHNLTSEELTPGTYYEADPAMNVRFPTGVKALIASASLFGSSAGDAVRSLAVRNGWVLFWAPGLNKSSSPSHHGLNVKDGPFNTRLVDPYVLAQIPAGANSTAGDAFAAAAKAFAGEWGKGLGRVSFFNLWTQLGARSSPLSVEPLFPGACARSDCAGVRTMDDACICAQGH